MAGKIRVGVVESTNVESAGRNLAQNAARVAQKLLELGRGVGTAREPAPAPTIAMGSFREGKGSTGPMTKALQRVI